MRVRAVLVAALTAGLLVMAWTSTASAGLSDQTALAKRYAPVVRLVAQDYDCGAGESYQPMDIGALLPNATVALRGPWGGGDLVKIGPTAQDLARGLYDYHLDFPGDALNPGCGYEKWARRVTKGFPVVAYAHVASEKDAPGKLALQYWFFYAFNDWNNLHEGDWEMIQLNFDAGSAHAALSVKPVSVGYSQHEGAERASWGDSKLEIVNGTHPVVHPADGSHANFYSEALFLGSSGSSGVGCDDTLGPTYDVHPLVETIPSDPAAAGKAFPWIDFQGRWGELQPAFFNGPTGPNLKTQWTEPIRWSEGWRSRAIAVPAGGALGNSTTEFFCGAVAQGSRLLTQALDNPPATLLVLALLIGVAAIVCARSAWRPSAPLRLVRRRAWGQILAASWRMYRDHFRLFVGMGAILIPVALLDGLMQALVLRASSVAGIDTEAGGEGFLVLLVVAFGTLLTLLAVAVVQASTLRALVELDQGRSIGPVRAYRLGLERARPMLGGLAVAVVIVTLLAGTIVLIPIAIALAVRWSLIVPVVVLEGRSAGGALRRSGHLVGRRWLKVACLTILSYGIVLLAGPLLGTGLVLLTDASLALLNAIAGVVYAVLLPFVAITTSYVYFDVRVRSELDAVDDDEEVLDAESELVV